MVSKPWGDSAPYDFMIEHNGRVLRVQVKSTMRIVRGCYRCHVPYNRGQGSPQRLMDFVAAYVIPEDLWYILPARVATCLQGHISLSPHRPGHKYEPYLEAWQAALRFGSSPFVPLSDLRTGRVLLSIGLRWSHSPNTRLAKEVPKSG